MPLPNAPSTYPAFTLGEIRYSAPHCIDQFERMSFASGTKARQPVYKEVSHAHRSDSQISALEDLIHPESCLWPSRTVSNAVKFWFYCLTPDMQRLIGTVEANTTTSNFPLLNNLPCTLKYAGSRYLIINPRQGDNAIQDAVILKRGEFISSQVQKKSRVTVTQQGEMKEYAAKAKSGVAQQGKTKECAAMAETKVAQQDETKKDVATIETKTLAKKPPSNPVTLVNVGNDISQNGRQYCKSIGNISLERYRAFTGSAAAKKRSFRLGEVIDRDGNKTVNNLVAQQQLRSLAHALWAWDRLTEQQKQRYNLIRKHSDDEALDAFKLLPYDLLNVGGQLYILTNEFLGGGAFSAVYRCFPIVIATIKPEERLASSPAKIQRQLYIGHPMADRTKTATTTLDAKMKAGAWYNIRENAWMAGNDQRQMNRQYDVGHDTTTSWEKHTENWFYNDELAVTSHNIVPEFSGRSVEQWLKYGSLTVDQRLQLAHAVIEAVGKLQKAGVKHGDIKPSNMQAVYNKETGRFKVDIFDRDGACGFTIGSSKSSPYTQGYCGQEQLIFDNSYDDRWAAIEFKIRPHPKQYDLVGLGVTIAQIMTKPNFDFELFFNRMSERQWRAGNRYKEQDQRVRWFDRLRIRQFSECLFSGRRLNQSTPQRSARQDDAKAGAIEAAIIKAVEPNWSKRKMPDKAVFSVQLEGRNESRGMLLKELGKAIDLDQKHEIFINDSAGELKKILVTEGDDQVKCQQVWEAIRQQVQTLFPSRANIEKGVVIPPGLRQWYDVFIKFHFSDAAIDLADIPKIGGAGESCNLSFFKTPQKTQSARNFDVPQVIGGESINLTDIFHKMRVDAHALPSDMFDKFIKLRDIAKYIARSEWSMMFGGELSRFKCIDAMIPKRAERALESIHNALLALLENTPDGYDKFNQYYEQAIFHLNHAISDVKFYARLDEEGNYQRGLSGFFTTRSKTNSESYLKLEKVCGLSEAAPAA